MLSIWWGSFRRRLGPGSSRAWEPLETEGSPWRVHVPEGQGCLERGVSGDGPGSVGARPRSWECVHWEGGLWGNCGVDGLGSAPRGVTARSLTRIPGRLSSGTAEGLKVQTERTRSMLLFANVSARHYGNYTCRAANRLGTSSASMRLLRASVCWSAGGAGPERQGRGGESGRGLVGGDAGTAP